MYSPQKIPAPFGGAPRKKAAAMPPAPPEKPVSPKEIPIPIEAAEEKRSLQKAAPASHSPLLALLLFDLFSNKEG